MATKTKPKQKKTETAPKVLNVAFVWDMSGSMAAIDGATREGTNGYLMDLQTEERKLIAKHGVDTYTRFSLTAFDTAFETWLVDEPIMNIDIESVIARYGPRGGTALYDAIANTITQLDTSGRDNEKFLMIVMTDGHENASKEYGGPDGKTKLFNLIKRYEAKGNWTFVYLGANVDAYAEARDIGIPLGNTMAYSASPGSTSKTASAVYNVTNSLRFAALDSSATSFHDAGEEQDVRDADDPGRNS